MEQKQLLATTADGRDGDDGFDELEEVLDDEQADATAAVNETGLSEIDQTVKLLFEQEEHLLNLHMKCEFNP